MVDVHVGLITGLGPASTVAYYRRLTSTMASAGQSLELTMVEADIRQVLANSLADRRQEQAEEFAKLLHRLHAAGADFASITAIGPHFCWNETLTLSPLPMVSAIAPLDSYCCDQGYRNVGLLGTVSAMRTHLFGQMARTKVLVPENPDSIGSAYQTMALEGRCDDATRRIFTDAGHAMMEQGADVVALAGTDLLLAFDGHDPGFPVVDALELHVSLLADLALNRKSLF